MASQDQGSIQMKVLHRVPHWILGKPKFDLQYIKETGRMMEIEDETL